MIMGPKDGRPAIETIPDPEDDGNSKFARALGSGDYHTRDKGLKALTQWLQNQQSISDSALKKIWKGVFFCFWHSDKAHVQEDLAVRLAGIFPQLREEVAFKYYREFVDTIRREWVRIDRLRLDKFMMLVRKFLAQLFDCMAERKWEKEYVARYMKMLLSTAFEAEDALAVVGFSLHVADIFLAELIRASSAAKCPVPKKRAKTLLQPFVAVLGMSHQPALIARIRASVFEALADELCSPSAGEPLQAFDAQPLAELLFAAGGLQHVRHKNRAALYDLSQRFEAVDKKRKRDAGASGGDADDDDAARTTKKRSKLAAATAPEPPPAKKPKAKKRKAGVLVLDAAAGDAAAEEQRTPVDEAPVTATPKSKSKRARSKEAAGRVEQDKGVLALTPVQAEPASASPASTAKKAKTATPVPAEAPAPKQAANGTRSRANAKRKSLPQAGAAPHAATRLQSQLPTPATAPPAVRSAVEEPQIDLMPAKLVKPHFKVATRLSTASANVTPEANGVSAPVKAALESAIRAVSAAKKSIHFNLKKNTVHQIGKPLPPANIRTPPHAKPNGSALKKVSTLPTVPADPKIARRLSFSKSPRQNRQKASDFI